MTSGQQMCLPNSSVQQMCLSGQHMCLPNSKRRDTSYLVSKETICCIRAPVRVHRAFINSIKLRARGTSSQVSKQTICCILAPVRLHRMIPSVLTRGILMLTKNTLRGWEGHINEQTPSSVGFELCTNSK